MKNNTQGRKMLLLLLLLAMVMAGKTQTASKAFDTAEIDKIVLSTMKKGDIPGLSLLLVKGNSQLIRTYGYSDISRRQPVTDATLFQLGSCSKAFTALAVLQLVKENRVQLDMPVQQYLPWFRVRYNDSAVNISMRQLLHHTSGIPWQSIAAIPAADQADALERTVKSINGIQLHRLPGKEYEYATINYDILALIVQQQSGMSFETYVNSRVLAPLGLTHTAMGEPADSSHLATGYKISFLKARAYEAPVFKGNNAAGYVIADAGDMLQWLRFQMGFYPQQSLYPLALQTQQRDESVAPEALKSYAMGWQVSLQGNGEISHTGENPNYTSYIAFRPSLKTGVVVMANSNSHFTPVIGDKIGKLLAGEKIEEVYDVDNGSDVVFTIVSAVLGCYSLLAIAYLFFAFIQIKQGKRYFTKAAGTKLKQQALSLLLLTPLLYGIYLMPQVIGFNWKAVQVWSPDSFTTLVATLLLAIGASTCVVMVNSFFPGKQNGREKAVAVVLVSVVSGIANMALILLITSSLKDTDIALGYIIYYYLVTLFVYIRSRQYVQASLIYITRDIIYKTRLELIEKVFATSYQKFEKLDRGRVYATLNNDIATVGESANMIVMLVTSVITACGIFLYLAMQQFWASVLTIALIFAISVLYSVVSRKTAVYFEQARDRQSDFLRLINGMIDGFKEISLHRVTKTSYQKDIEEVTGSFKEKTTRAQMKFLHASLIGELSFVFLLGAVALGIPKMFPGIPLYSVMNFVVLLLYLNGPLNTILNAVPAVMQLKVSWGRIQGFVKAIPGNLALQHAPAAITEGKLYSFRAENLSYTYTDDEGNATFSVGPVSFEAARGEILFIIGGNGSGKTTLAKMMLGLYEPSAGTLLVNDQVVLPAQVGEYFSAIFSPGFLFDKMYGVDMHEKGALAQKYLCLLGLEHKVTIENNQFSTIHLSSGQRKRLALLQCYLEDRPIYLFDEWTADQDPEYRSFFYRELLPQMKKEGKIVIAITHDDHYFDVADRILKMDMGEMDYVSNGFKVDALFTTNV